MFRKKIQLAIEALIPAGTIFVVTASEQADHGDYSSNVAMVLSKKLGKNPKEVAEDLKSRLLPTLSKLVEKIEIAGPGFINFTITQQALTGVMKDILEKPDEWGTSNVGNKQTVILDYFQLNIAKAPHIGHLRSAVIGDSLKRMLIASGYHAVSDTHVGDWGTQFGILLAYLKGEFQTLPEGWDWEKMIADDPFSKLQQYYIEANNFIDNNPSARELAKEEFAKLEKGDTENRKIWRRLVEISMKKLEDSVLRLNLLPFDEHRGESAYEDEMPKIVESALQKGVAKKLADGAIVVDLNREGLDDAVLIKSDGASTYLLRDLATIIHRKEKWNFSQNLYLVDVRQSHHFNQVFMVAELLGYEGVGESKHISFGFMKLPEGTMSTRTGNVISLDAVIDETIQRVEKIIQEKNPTLPNRRKVAEMVGLGALKYFDLSHNRTSDIIFEWDRALSFEGSTGSYIQYTHARQMSILKKAGGVPDTISNSSLDAVEHNLLVSILQLPEYIEDALVDFTPSTLANYLFHLAQLANEFYNSHQVMNESDPDKKNLRITLVGALVLTLKRGLYMLGIDAPEEM